MHQLLIGFLPLIDDLPAPQRQALQVAFGLTAGPAPEPFLVGLACLTLLSRTAADQPVLTIVDDAHWIDAESAQVLGFVARRLYADRVGMLLVVADAERNSLALVDVGSHYTAEELAARAYQPVPIPVGRQLQDRYLHRVRRLPREVQEFVLLAAADVSGDCGRGGAGGDGRWYRRSRAQLARRLPSR